MSDKTINLAPSEWRKLQPRSPVASCAVVATTCLGLLLLTWSDVDTHFAEAAPIDPVPPTEILDPWTKIPTDHLAHHSFGRLESWYPWDEILVHVARGLGPGDSLQHCAYDADKRQLEVTGNVEDLEVVRTMVLEFSQWGFLRNPDAFRASTVDQRTEFGVRLDVSPAIRRETR
ncbi:MAG: hypothetical protein AAF488_08785 [Planctomycetota bacterium]